MKYLRGRRSLQKSINSVKRKFEIWMRRWTPRHNFRKEDIQHGHPSPGFAGCDNHTFYKYYNTIYCKIRKRECSFMLEIIEMASDITGQKFPQSLLFGNFAINIQITSEYGVNRNDKRNGIYCREGSDKRDCGDEN
ncbi:UNVERIFIED_CONTAM: hypothetical protein PYX00_003366 [Menopon gallinae]|uniref:Uncharacterized protein n=1 Tax=Menopon gallinae TaxID=328185 RepID=A0AAW2I1C5_9NEOP